MRRNTKLLNFLFIISFIVSGIFNVIGIASDIFGFAQGVEDNRNVFINILSYFSENWKWTALITIVILLVFSFYWKMRKRRIDIIKTEGLSWFDAEMRSTDYVNEEDYLFQLKNFLTQKNAAFSWWTITGVTGMGKTRLVNEALTSKEFRKADIQWLKTFDDFREEALKSRIDSILESSKLMNIIIAEDAQIYMDNIGVLIEYISEKKVSEIGDHKIKLILLVRLDEKENLQDRYRQLASKSSNPILWKTQYREELRITRYSESAIANIVKSYVVNTKKKRAEDIPSIELISILQRKVIDALKSEGMDAEHLRPLFAMFITDALLAGKDPLSWNREKVLEYAVVEREEKLMKDETRDIKEEYSHRIYEKVRCITCMSIIRNGIKLSELGELGEELEDELKFSKIALKDFLKELQLIGNEGIIRVYMPNILSEYYVLRSLVIEPEKDIVEWVISRLCESLEGAKAFRNKVRQDFIYLYESIEDKLDDFYNIFFEKCESDIALNIISNLLNSGELCDSNEVILHEAIGSLIPNKENVEQIAQELANIIYKDSDPKVLQVCLFELRRLQYDTESDAITYSYCEGLSQMIVNSVFPIEDDREFISELKRISVKYAKKYKFEKAYCCGLAHIINNDPNIDNKLKYLSELLQISVEYKNDVGIDYYYAGGLVNIINSTADNEDLRDASVMRNSILELKRLAKKHEESMDINQIYALGLYDTIGRLSGTSLEDNHELLVELRELFDKYAHSNNKFAIYYCNGLYNMADLVSIVDERWKYLLELKRLSQIYTGIGEIAIAYANGLGNFVWENHRSKEIKGRVDFHIELRRLFWENYGNIKVSEACSRGFANVTSGNFISYDEKSLCISELKMLTEKYSGNLIICEHYCIGLYNMILMCGGTNNNYISELYRLLSEESLAQYIMKKDTIQFQSIYPLLLDYEQRIGITKGLKIYLNK